MILISIIIPVFQDFNRLVKCLESIENSNFDLKFIEVIVVNNEHMSLELPDYSFKIISTYQKKKGSYACRNKGISLASGSLCAFTDSDCIVDKNWLSVAFEAFKNDADLDILTGPVNLFRVDENKPINVAEVIEISTAFPQYMYFKRLNFGVTANLVVKTSMFNSFKFNNELKSGGDREFCNKQVQNGAKLDYSNWLIINHPARNSLTQMNDKSIRVFDGLIMKKEFLLDKLILTFKQIVPPFERIIKILFTKNISIRLKILAVIELYNMRFKSFVRGLFTILNLNQN